MDPGSRYSSFLSESLRYSDPGTKSLYFDPYPSDILIRALDIHHFYPDPSDIMIRASNHYILIRIRRIYGSGLLIFIIFIYLDPSDIWIRALNLHYIYPDQSDRALNLHNFYPDPLDI